MGAGRSLRRQGERLRAERREHPLVDGNRLGCVVKSVEVAGKIVQRPGVGLTQLLHDRCMADTQSEQEPVRVGLRQPVEARGQFRRIGRPHVDDPGGQDQPVRGGEQILG